MSVIKHTQAQCMRIRRPNNKHTHRHNTYAKLDDARLGTFGNASMPLSPPWPAFRVLPTCFLTLQELEFGRAVAALRGGLAVLVTI